jgi:arylsulfatase B
VRRLRLLVVSILLCAFAMEGCPEGEEVPQPNIVIMIADDLGWADVGYHGSQIRTPNLDRLATEGVRLDRFYVSSVCVPTRAGVMTGRYPERMGLHLGGMLGMKDKALPPHEDTLAEVLGRAGYEHRMAVGKWHLGSASTDSHPMHQGFTGFYGHLGGSIHYFTHRQPYRPHRKPHKRGGQLDWHRDHSLSHDRGYSTDLLGREAVRFVESVPENRPFLLYLAFNAPHEPLEAKPEDLALYLEDPWWQRSRWSSDRTMSTYAAVVTAMDRQIGRVLQAIESKGAAEDTLVWFFSDNGGVRPRHNAPLTGMKMTDYEGGIRVPSVIRWPRRIEGGRKVEALIGYVDVLPSVAAAAGYAYQASRPIDGINVLPILTGEQPAPQRAIFPIRSVVVTQRWKLFEGKLYDLSSDPREKHNLASREPGVLADLREMQRDFDTIGSRRRGGRAGCARSDPAG